MNDSPRYSSLRDYLHVIRAHRLLILTITLVAGGAALYFSARQRPVYEATAVISFQDETQDLGVLGTSVAVGASPEQLPAARAQTIDEPDILRKVKHALGTKLPIATLQADITAAVDTKSNLVNVSGRSGGPVFATRLTNEFANQVQKTINSDARTRFAAAAKVLKRRFNHLKDTPANGPEKVSLADQITRLQFLTTTSTPAHIVKAPQTPGAPISPRPVRNTLLGLLAGLVLGLVLAFLRDSLDRRLRGSHEIQAELEYSLLGQVRAEAMGRAVRAGTGQDPKLAPDVEASRILRQNLEFLSVDEPLRLVLVTSALPQEGKSTVAASLAFAKAMAGERTLLLECDLRRPALAARLGLSPVPGLTDYLAGTAEPQDIVQAVEVGEPISLNGSNGSRSSVSSAQTFACITAGTMSDRPAELLGSRRFEEFLEEITSVYDAVIVDTSPLLPVADTLELLPRVDGVVLCVRSAQTTREQALAAKTALQHYPERPTGVVVTGLRPRDDADYGYYYSYSYAYTSKS